MTESRPSPDGKVTTAPARFPPMIVTSGPCSLSTVTAFPWKLMFSKYVPGATRTVSPALAKSIALWMVGLSPGTVMTTCADADPVEKRDTTDGNNAIIRTKGNFLWNRLACIERLPARLLWMPRWDEGIFDPTCTSSSKRFAHRPRSIGIRGRPYGLGVLGTFLRAAIGGLPACAR